MKKGNNKASVGVDDVPTPEFHASDAFRITPPAVVTLVAYLIMAFIILMPFDMYAWDDKQSRYVRYKYSISQRIFLLVLLLFPLLLSVYSVNCFVVGRCHIFSWIVATVTIVWALAVIIAALVNRAFNVDDIM